MVAITSPSRATASGEDAAVDAPGQVDRAQDHRGWGRRRRGPGVRRAQHHAGQHDVGPVRGQGQVRRVLPGHAVAPEPRFEVTDHRRELRVDGDEPATPAQPDGIEQRPAAGLAIEHRDHVGDEDPHQVVPAAAPAQGASGSVDQVQPGDRAGRAPEEHRVERPGTGGGAGIPGGTGPIGGEAGGGEGGVHLAGQGEVVDAEVELDRSVAHRRGAGVGSVEPRVEGGVGRRAQAAIRRGRAGDDDLVTVDALEQASPSELAGQVHEVGLHPAGVGAQLRHQIGREVAQRAGPVHERPHQRRRRAQEVGPIGPVVDDEQLVADGHGGQAGPGDGHERQIDRAGVHGRRS